MSPDQAGATPSASRRPCAVVIGRLARPVVVGFGTVTLGEGSDSSFPMMASRRVPIAMAATTRLAAAKSQDASSATAPWSRCSIRRIAAAARAVAPKVKAQ
ncbi:hypothetical protein GCM10011390_23170 [Aureimonas endophytica]|uniref:Uncharacterized protein n=1 Tax=Aureimonas endophytica TaxID=2027858 RepID=A0A916ZLJ1_9HYPH|nr:hypothetical protein GCM10011390_23170 [Aureimonas endophytica]